MPTEVALQISSLIDLIMEVGFHVHSLVKIVPLFESVIPGIRTDSQVEIKCLIHGEWYIIPQRVTARREVAL